MGTVVIVLLIIINVFKIGYMQPCKGNGQMITNIRGINYGFQYTLKITCRNRSELNAFTWLLFRSFYVRVRFIPTHKSPADPDEMSPMTPLQTLTDIPNGDLRKASSRIANFTFRRTSTGRSTSKVTIPKRLKRNGNTGECIPVAGGRKRRSCKKRPGTGAESTIAVSAPTAQITTVPKLVITAAFQRTPSTTLMNLFTTPLSTPLTTETTPSATPMLTSTTLSITGMTTSITPSTTSTIATTSTVSSSTLKTKNTTLLTFTPSSTRTTQTTTPSITTNTQFTRLKTTTSTSPSTTPSTTNSTLSTMHSRIPLTSLSSRGITQSKLSTSTSPSPNKLQSSIPSTTKMTTAITRTPCIACSSTPLSTPSTISSQHSLETAPSMTTTYQQTTTAGTYKSSKSSKITTLSPLLETYVSPSIKETTSMDETPITTTFILKSSSAANTETANTVIRPSTTSPRTTKATTSMLVPVTLLVTSTPRFLTTIGVSTGATSPTETTAVPIGTTLASPNAEQISSSAFVDDPLNVALVSILAGFTAIGSIIGIIRYVRSRIAGAQNNRSNSIANESAATSSGSSSGDNLSRYSGNSSPSNIPIYSTVSKSPLLTPVETV